MNKLLRDLINIFESIEYYSYFDDNHSFNKVSRLENEKEKKLKELLTEIKKELNI